MSPFVAVMTLCFFSPLTQPAPNHPRLFFTGSDVRSLVEKSKDTSETGYGVTMAKMWDSIQSHADAFSTITAYLDLTPGSSIKRPRKAPEIVSDKTGRITVAVGDTIEMPPGGGTLTRLPLGANRILTLRVVTGARITTSADNRRLVYLFDGSETSIGPDNRIGWNVDPLEGDPSGQPISIRPGDTLSIGFGNGLQSDLHSNHPYQGEAITIAGPAVFVVSEPLFYFVEDIPTVPAGHDDLYPRTATFQYVLCSRMPPHHFGSHYFSPWTRLTDYLWIETKYLAVAYEIRGDQRYYDVLRHIMLSIAGWSDWTDKDANPGWASNLDTANLLKIEAFCYDVLYDRMSPSERKVVEDAMAAKGIMAIEKTLNLEDVYNRPDDVGARVHSYVNTLAIQLGAFGIGSVALLGANPKAQGWVNEAKAAITLVFNKISPPTGGFYEGFGYGSAATDAITEMINVMIKSGRLPRDYFGTSPFYARLTDFVFDMLSPVDHRLVTFGDAPLDLYFGRTMDILASHGNTAASWYMKWRYPDLLKLWGNEVMPFVRYNHVSNRPGVSEPASMSAVFPEVGYAVLRNDTAQTSPFLVFKCGPPNLAFGHDHFDQNSFAIDYLGKWLITAPGYQNFSDPFARKYTLGTFGQNTMVMDINPEYLSSPTYALAGHDQMTQAGGQIEEFWSSKIFASVTGQAAKAYNLDASGHSHNWLTSFRRTIIYSKPDYFLIQDQVSSPNSHEFSMLFHSDSTARFQPLTDGAVIGKGSVELIVKSISSCGFSAVGVHQYPRALKYGDYLELRSNPTNSFYCTTLLFPRRAVKAGSVNQDTPIFKDVAKASGFSIETTEYSDVLIINHSFPGPASFSYSGSRYSTDARICLISRNPDGKIRRISMEDGKYVSVNGDTLVAASTDVGAFVEFTYGKTASTIRCETGLAKYVYPPASASVEVSADVRITDIDNAGKADFLGGSNPSLSDGYWESTVSVKR